VQILDHTTFLYGTSVALA